MGLKGVKTRHKMWGTCSVRQDCGFLPSIKDQRFQNPGEAMGRISQKTREFKRLD
jgi:hypothetical protein